MLKSSSTADFGPPIELMKIYHLILVLMPIQKAPSQKLPFEFTIAYFLFILITS
jgi:hypothetical protein